MGYIENEALLSFCYLFGASRETCEHITYEDAPQETLRKSTNRTAQLTLLVPKDLLVSDDEAYDSLAEGLFNPVGSSLKECYPCDPDGSVYLGFQSELKAKNFDESAKKLRAKSLFNDKLMHQEACFRHIQEQYVSERKKLNPSEFADLPPPTEAYLKLTEKCKAAKQMRK
jgi:hypothetical protein